MQRAPGSRPRAARAWPGLALALALACGGSDAPSDAGAGTQPASADASISHPLSGTVLKVSKDWIAVRDLGEGSDGQTAMTLAGGTQTPVKGVKHSWIELRAGDYVALSYTGDPPRVEGIEVMQKTLPPELAAAAQAVGLHTATGARDPYKKGGRVFVGWIKQVDAHGMAVRTPDGPDGSERKGEVKTFSRQPETVVELLRDSWDSLKKGDRVSVRFRKGEPRPAERIQVILRGGEKPLPPGLATRLYDPAYDQSVAEVDGIGEWPPGKPWPPQEG